MFEGVLDIEKYIDILNEWIWSDVFIAFALLTGIYFTVSTKFVQLFHVRRMIKLLFSGKASAKGVSSFQAFVLAISGRIGTGNIAGVATAIAMGGPGAVFWMWVIAILGAATACVEATLGQMFKVEKDGQYRGGPAFYIEQGLHSKVYALIFSVVTIISCTFFLPAVQSNSIAVSMNHAFSLDTRIVGFVIAGLLGLIIFGGVKRIVKVAEVVVPFMAVGYIGMAAVIIGMNLTAIPGVFKLIYSSAFNLDATFSGVFGMAIAWGVKRGIYSNEAGQGTAPHSAAAAEVKHPMEQGLVQAFSVYIDTLFVCTATALMILFTKSYNVVDPSGGFVVENVPGLIEGPAYTQIAIATYFPSMGAAFVSIALFFFVFTTLMAYYYMAETNLSYLTPRHTPKYMTQALRIVFLFIVIYGTYKESSFAWKLGDVGVGLMAWLNIVALILLRKIFMKSYKDYFKKYPTIKSMSKPKG